MKKISFLLLFIVLFTFSYTPVFAQIDNTQGIESYNLDGCIKYAIQNSELLKKNNLDVLSAEQTIKQTNATGLPQISARMGFTDNIVIQKNVIPGNTFPINPTPEPLALAFGAKFTSNASINVEQLIFDFSYLIGLQASRVYKDLSVKVIAQNKIDIIEKVTKGYYAVLINDERMKLIDANLLRVDTLLKYTQALQKNGLAEKIDVLRLEVTLNNLKTQKDQIVALQDFSKKLLKFQMGMPVKDSLILQGNIREVVLGVDNLQNIEADFTQRAEYDLLETNRKAQLLTIRYNKSLGYPSLRGNFAYGANTGSNNFSDLTQFNKRYFSFAYYGLSLNIPIYDGGRRKAGVQKSRIDLAKVEEDIKIFKKVTDFQVEQAKFNIINSLKDLDIQKKNMELAGEISRIAQAKFKGGTGTYIEIIDAENTFKQAENAYFTAYYNAIIAKVDLDKALGKLKE